MAVNVVISLPKKCSFLVKGASVGWVILHRQRDTARSQDSLWLLLADGRSFGPIAL